MMKHAIPIGMIAALMLTGGCSSDDGTLPRSKMADVMADMTLAEAWLENNPDKNNEAERERLRKGILESNGVTQQEYDATLAMYGHNLDKYYDLLDDAEKRLTKRSKQLLKEEKGGGTHNDGSSLWPYGSLAMVSPKGGTRSITFSIPPGELRKGEELTWSMRLSNNPGSIIVLGVDYDGGETSYYYQRTGGSSHVEANLITDSLKEVKRIYGYLQFDPSAKLPVWADSIALHHSAPNPDGINRYSQFNYTPPTSNKKKQKKNLSGDRDSLRIRPTVKPITGRPGSTE